MTTGTVAHCFSTHWKNQTVRVALVATAAACLWPPLSAIAGAAIPSPSSVTQQADNTEASLSLDERKLVQEGLIWTGLYKGELDANFGKEEMRDAITALQRQNTQPVTGILNTEQIMFLARSALNMRDALGWEKVRDPQTGMRLAYPSKTLTELSSPNINTVSMESRDKKISMQIERLMGQQPGEFDRLYNGYINDRQATISHNFRNDHMFTIAGSRGQVQFYVHYEQSGNEVRRLQLAWFEQSEELMKPMALMISRNFDPFDVSPPHKKPDYSYLSKLAQDALNQQPAVNKPPVVPAQ